MSKKCVVPPTTPNKEVSLQDPTRREFGKIGLSLLGGAALMAMVRPACAAARGRLVPMHQKRQRSRSASSADRLRFGVIASVMGFDKKYGIKIIPSKEASWAGVRDKLVNGELDAAHVLYGLMYGVQMGIGGQKKDMAVLMNLNHNGQAITPFQPAQGQRRG